MDRTPPLHIVGVMGSGRAPHTVRSRRVGEWLARAGYHLLTGGGPGVMAAVTEAFVGVADRPGRAIGILPAVPPDAAGAAAGSAPSGYPNPWVEIAIRTHLHRLGAHGGAAGSRNHLNVLSSDALIILPGGEGTASEARLALHYKRPCIAYLAHRNAVPGLPADIRVAPRFEGVVEFVRNACASRPPQGASGGGDR